MHRFCGFNRETCTAMRLFLAPILLLQSTVQILILRYKNDGSANVVCNKTNVISVAVNWFSEKNLLTTQTTM